MTTRVRVEYDDKQLRKNAAEFGGKFRSAISAVVDRRAAETEKWLKQNAPWTDRTGAARAGLFAVPHHAATFEEIFMAYSVNYSIWLEVANDRRFAVIQPAMQIQGQALLRDMQYLIDRMASAGIVATPAQPIPKQPDKPQKPYVHHDTIRRGGLGNPRNKT